MKRILLLFALFFGSALFSGTAFAVDPPYQKDMERLAHIMGALYHLDRVCLQSGTNWRQDFAQLMDLDEVDNSRRNRLTAAFNTGYGDYSRLYIKCTTNAKALLVRFAKEGELISHNIHTRFAE